MVFTGTYLRALDKKLRAALPKRLRAEFSEDIKLFLTPGTDQCLELHTDESLNELASRISQSSAGSKNIRSFSRLFYARAEQCDVDSQGRIRIPSSLAQIADFSKEIVFVGVGPHWEVWDHSRWQAYLEQNQQAFDLISETTFDPPINQTNQVDGEATSQKSPTNKVTPK